MAINKKLNRAECILGMLFGFRTDHEPDNKLVEKAVWAFKDYVHSIRPVELKGHPKGWAELLESLDLNDKDV
ncbi:MAG: hypothetical protein ACXADH_14765 [Candidatus Kariarchaeaceae archaeon]|jgi:hypothetical protein